MWMVSLATSPRLTRVPTAHVPCDKTNGFEGEGSHARPTHASSPGCWRSAPETGSSNRCLASAAVGGDRPPTQRRCRWFSWRRPICQQTLSRREPRLESVNRILHEEADTSFAGAARQVPSERCLAEYRAQRTLSTSMARRTLLLALG